MRTYAVRLADEAVADLERIFSDLLPVAGEHVSRDFVQRLYAACMKLDVFPARGNRHDDLRPGLRIVGYRRQATIAFVVGEADVTILRIFRRGADVRAELGETGAWDADE